jgi:hypothetical protein
MNYMVRVASQLQTVEAAHFGNLVVAGSRVAGKTVAEGTADSVKIAVDWGYIEELGVSIQVVGDKAAGKLL